jgi:xylan 1,4-beta-xylosidase
MNSEMNGFAELYHWLKTSESDPDPQHHSGLCTKVFGRNSFNHVGFEGMFMFKANAQYYWCDSDNIHGRYSCFIATSQTLLGTYSARYEAIPHAGHNMIFQDLQGKWWSSYFGSDNLAPWQEKPGLIPLLFDDLGKIQFDFGWD